MDDGVIVEKILRSLAPKFDYVVCSIEESKDIDALSIDELQSSLLVHEQKMNRSSNTDEQALKAFTFTQFSNSGGGVEVEVEVKKGEVKAIEMAVDNF